MSNRARGFIDVELGNEKISLGLPMGALAYIESEYNVGAFEQALDFLNGDNVSASKVMKFILTVIKANDIEITPERQKAIYNWSPTMAMEVIVDLMKVSGFVAGANDKGGSSARPLAAKNAGKRG